MFRIRNRIRIRLDPDSNCHAGSVFGIRILKVKLSYKNPLFPKKFHDFHLFLKMIPNKSSLFNKIGTYLLDWLKTKIKYLHFGLKTKFLPKFCFCLRKIGFLLPRSGSGWVKKSGIRIRKKLNPDPKHCFQDVFKQRRKSPNTGCQTIPGISPAPRLRTQFLSTLLVV